MVACLHSYTYTFLRVFREKEVLREQKNVKEKGTGSSQVRRNSLVVLSGENKKQYLMCSSAWSATMLQLQIAKQNEGKKGSFLVFLVSLDCTCFTLLPRI